MPSASHTGTSYDPASKADVSRISGASNIGTLAWTHRNGYRNQCMKSFRM
jgi:hypothetical protein